MPRTTEVAQSKLEKLVGKLKAYVKEHKARPFQPRPKGSKLRVFSDCAGISAETIALTLLGLKQFFTIVGGSEIDEVKRCLIGVVHETCRTSCKSVFRAWANCCFGSSKAASAMKKCLKGSINSSSCLKEDNLNLETSFPHGEKLVRTRNVRFPCHEELSAK